MKFITLALITAITTLSFAQSSNFNTQRNWAMNKKEISLGFGVTQFLGDLGGANRIGTDYSLRDMDFASTSIGGSLSYRYRFHPYYATSTMLNIGMVKGNDALTTEFARNARNLSFRSLVINLSQRFEIIVLANEKIGRRYNIPGLRGFVDHNEQLYLIAGIGVMYYNPKTQYNGSWVALQPLHTEGQGLPGGPEQYKRITATVPLGIGFRMGINRMWRIGIEAMYVKTFSDYIDDVGGVYYDRGTLLAQYGQASADLSNRSTIYQANGEMRGQKQKDALFYVNIMVTRNITYKSSTRRGPMKFGKRSYKAKF
jgi:hypothetical protein